MSYTRMIPACRLVLWWLSGSTKNDLVEYKPSVRRSPQKSHARIRGVRGVRKCVIACKPRIRHSSRAWSARVRALKHSGSRHYAGLRRGLQEISATEGPRVLRASPVIPYCLLKFIDSRSLGGDHARCPGEGTLVRRKK